MELNDYFEIMNEVTGDDKFMLLLTGNLLLMALGEKALKEEVFEMEEIEDMISDVQARVTKLVAIAQQDESED